MQWTVPMILMMPEVNCYAPWKISSRNLLENWIRSTPCDLAPVLQHDPQIEPKSDLGLRVYGRVSLSSA